MGFHEIVAGIDSGKKPWLITHGSGKQTPRFRIVFLKNTRNVVNTFYETAIEADDADNSAPASREKFLKLAWYDYSSLGKARYLK